jgi:hypothetical protein
MPSVQSLLDTTDMLVLGRVGEPQSHLSDDQMVVFTDYRLNNPDILFERKPPLAETGGPPRSIIVTQRGGTLNIQGIRYTESEEALGPLKPGSEVLCLLKQAGDKYQIVGWYFGVFEIENGVLKPLMSREDFALDYRGKPLRDAVQSMVAVLQTGPTLEGYIEDRTGPGAVDCGTFSTIHNGVALPPRPSSKATNKVDSMRESLTCAEQALKDHKGFKIVQRSPTFDTEVVTGVVGNPAGATSWFTSETTPAGWRVRPTFYTRPCSLTDVEIVPTPEGNHLFKCGR